MPADGADVIREQIGLSARRNRPIYDLEHGHHLRALRLCGKRQLRNLLRDGEGVFWVRDEETIWLRSAAKAAHALGVERLTGRPVALPVEALLNGIGNFRAHLYAAFHSGRTKETRRGSEAMPTKGRF